LKKLYNDKDLQLVAPNDGVKAAYLKKSESFLASAKRAERGRVNMTERLRLPGILPSNESTIIHLRKITMDLHIDRIKRRKFQPCPDNFSGIREDITLLVQQPQ